MTGFSKKLVTCACVCALTVFASNVESPITAEAFGIKLPKITLPGNASKNPSAQQDQTMKQIPKGEKRIKGQAFFNNSNNDLPATGFDVYLVHGALAHSDYTLNGETITFHTPAMKLGTTDEQGKFSFPVPPNVEEFVAHYKFPCVKILLFKPYTAYTLQEVPVSYIGEHIDIRNLSANTPFQTGLGEINFVDD